MLKNPIKIIFLSLLVFTYCQKDNSNLQEQWIGIITTKRLAQRQQPNIKSKLIGYKEFGSIIHFVQKSRNIDTISGQKNHWYKDIKTNTWLFGEYIRLFSLKDIKLSRLKEKNIYCNKYCGLITKFDPILINDYYYISFHLEPGVSVCDGSDNSVIAIGKTKDADNSIIFSLPSYYGLMGCLRSKASQKIHRKCNKVSLVYNDFFKHFNVNQSLKIIHKSDSNGAYYTFKYKNFDRDLIVKTCSRDGTIECPYRYLERLNIPLKNILEMR